MLYAEVDGSKRTAERGLEGYCPGCRGPLVPKCGELKTWHWAHQAGADCDTWPEKTGPWHLSWQEAVHPDNVEVLRGEHRADILGVNDTVIELQHSSISAEDIWARERFYGNMVWLFDATHRFRYVRTGNIVLFDVGKVKHINLCKKPVFFDFGTCIVEVQKFTDSFHKAKGVGIFRDRSWFTNKYLSGLLRSPVKLVFSEDKKPHPWDIDCPYHNITHISKWWINGKETIFPKDLLAYRVDVGHLNNIIAEFPEIANGWTKDGVSKMQELLTGTPIIFEGLLRVMPEPVDKMKVYVSSSEAKTLFKEYEVHAKAGRVPILKPETKQRIIELAKKNDRPWYR